VALKIGCAIGDCKRIGVAAQQAGVGTSTLYAWLKRGRAGDPRFTTLAEIIAQKRKPFDWSLFSQNRRSTQGGRVAPEIEAMNCKKR
jgi:hypothetical protein